MRDKNKLNLIYYQNMFCKDLEQEKKIFWKVMLGFWIKKCYQIIIRKKNRHNLILQNKWLIKKTEKRIVKTIQEAK